MLSTPAKLALPGYSRPGRPVPLTDPHYAGEFIHGAPMKGHGWSRFTNADLVRQMAAHVADNAPEGASTAWMEGR